MGSPVRQPVPISERCATIFTVPSGSMPRYTLGCQVCAAFSFGTSGTAMTSAPAENIWLRKPAHPGLPPAVETEERRAPGGLRQEGRCSRHLRLAHHDVERADCGGVRDFPRAAPDGGRGGAVAGDRAQ